MTRPNRGIARIPRLVEFHNSRFIARDFALWRYHYVTITDTDGENILMEFKHVRETRWETPDGENITTGEMIKRIYRACNPEVRLLLYVRDNNPAFPFLMRLNKVFEYRLTLGEMYEDVKNRFKQGYNLDCADDMKVFHSLKQVRELVYP